MPPPITIALDVIWPPQSHCASTAVGAYARAPTVRCAGQHRAGGVSGGGQDGGRRCLRVVVPDAGAVHQLTAELLITDVEIARGLVAHSVRPRQRLYAGCV